MDGPSRPISKNCARSIKGKEVQALQWDENQSSAGFEPRHCSPDISVLEGAASDLALNLS